MLEIEDERWRGAVEGYLNNQKFYFLVEPAYYEQALRIYNKLKWEKSLNAYGLVDIGSCASVSISTRRAAVLRKRWRPETRLREPTWIICSGA